MKIFTTSKFRSSYKKLPQPIKVRAKAREEIFKTNPFDSRLETHKLHGKYKNYWTFSIDNSYRIMFKFLKSDGGEVAFINIGTHEIYK